MHLRLLSCTCEMSHITCLSRTCQQGNGDCRNYNDGQYDFNYEMDGAQAMWNQYSYMNQKS